MSGPGAFPNPYVSKVDVVGRVVAVLRGVTEQRGLRLESFRSRAIPAGQVHELMLTDAPAGLESTVDRVALVAFVEITEGGVLLVGDRVEINAQHLGTLAGFDETHMPNHQNICLSATELTDGETRGIRLGDRVRFFRSDESAG